MWTKPESETTPSNGYFLPKWLAEDSEVADAIEHAMTNRQDEEGDLPGIEDWK